MNSRDGQLRRWWGPALAVALALAGCADPKSPAGAKEPAGPKHALYRGYGFWFQDLTGRFEAAANPKDGPKKYALKRLPDFDPLATDLYQQTVLMLSSSYPMTDLSFGVQASGMLQAVDVIVANSAWVEEFAQNGWLATFDESVYGPMLREAGVEPIRASVPGQRERAIYGIPITRAADFLFYRKGYFKDAAEARRAWLAGMTGAFPAKVPPFIVSDAQDIHRLFLSLVWSIEPDWPRKTADSFNVNTPAARTVLGALRRSAHINARAVAAQRVPFLVDLKRQINTFTAQPRPFDPAAAEMGGAAQPTCWLLSTWAQRILVTPWGPPAPLSDVGILPLTASPAAGRPGVSLAGGKCLVCSRQVESNDPKAGAARDVIRELVRYLLSEKGQRTLVYDQFEIPVRAGLLKSLTEGDLAAVFGSRRDWCDYERYCGEVKAGIRQIDVKSQALGRETLALLSEIGSAMDDPTRVTMRQNPLTIGQCMALDVFLCRMLDPSEAHAHEGVVNQDAEDKFLSGALDRFQRILEAGQRFIAARPGFADESSPGAGAKGEGAGTGEGR